MSEFAISLPWINRTDKGGHGRMSVPIKSTFLALVKSKDWQKDFLSRICAIHGYDALVLHSLDSRAPEARSIDKKRLVAQARELVQSMDVGELTAARQYYNNAQLLGFWRTLQSELQRHYNEGAIDAEFPLFQAQFERGSQSYRITKIGLAFFDQVNFNLAEHELLPTSKDPHIPPVLLRESAGEIKSRQAKLNKVFLQLSLLFNLQEPTITAFYHWFLDCQNRMQSPIWDYYKIHFFLDNFLYVFPDGTARRSCFSFVFGNSNLYELKIFLQYALDNKLRIRHGDVEVFLDRQRKFYLKLALEISLEHNEVHNRRKDLLAFDPEVGVVRARGITSEMLDYYQRTVLSPMGVVKQDGCPFAKSIGYTENALIEAFEHYDRLMLGLLKHSLDYRRVFGK